MTHRKFIRKHKLPARLGVSRSTIHRWEKNGILPPAVELGPRCVGWFEDILEAWETERENGSGNHEST